MADLPGHAGGVVAAAFTPDRTLLVSTDIGGSARVWVVGSSKPSLRGSVYKSGEHFRAAATAPNSRTVALGSGSSGLVRLFDLSEKAPTEGSSLRGARGAVEALAFSADGKLVAGGGEDQTLRIWEPGPGFRGDARAILPGHAKPIGAVAFAPDGTTAASGSRDGTARVWTLSRIRSSPRATLQHPAEVDAVAYLPDGKTLITACRDGRIRLWDLSAVSPPVRAEFAGHPGGTRHLVLASADLLVGTSDGSSVLNWDLRSGALVAKWDVQGGAGTSAALTPDGRYLARGSANGLVELFRVAEKRV